MLVERMSGCFEVGNTLLLFDCLATERAVLVRCDIIDRNAQLGRMSLIAEQRVFVLIRSEANVFHS